MTDRELLELAAKAAGYIPHASQSEMPGMLMVDHVYWSPLTDDGDALRLAVRLGLRFAAMDHSAIASYEGPGMWVYEQVPFDGDRHAATRRAIVLAAAEIGKEKVGL